MLATTLALLALAPQAALADFRVRPYLQCLHRDTLWITWFTEDSEPGTLILNGPGFTNKRFEAPAREMTDLLYSELEESERSEFPDMFANRNYKHQVVVRGLRPGGSYSYEVVQGKSRYRSRFQTPPAADTTDPIRFIAFGDCETDPDGRKIYRDWSVGTQAEGSTGRPEGKDTYLVTETEGFIENLKAIRKRNPAFISLAGDIVQGGGYQRAWDEFFFHTAGKFDDILGTVPLIPAIGNWETYGARNKGYEPEGIHSGRMKYTAYFDGPANNKREYEGFYHRVDYGPITMITLDSTNGLPDNTDNDTNVNIDAATYPGNDLVDLAPGSPQWNWCMEQLKDASEKGQIIFVQFHHIPYSSGGHTLPVTIEGSTGQAGWPMRMYTPWFQKYGVTAVLCGHNESFERSEVGGVLFYDAGVAGDGLGYAINDRDPRRINPWRKWVAHFDSAEKWNGKQLVDGGKHYGHLEIDVKPFADRFEVTFTPVYIFPVTNEEGTVTRFERRVYADVVKKTVPRRR